MEKKDRVLYGRKMRNLDELKEATQMAIRQGQKGSTYQVTHDVSLTEEAFERFASDFLADQVWIDPEAACIRVTNEGTGEKVLIDPQGYTYPRYTALENS